MKMSPHACMASIIAMLTTSIALGQSNQAAIDGASLRAEIVKLEQIIWDHWKAQRFDAMRDLIAADAIMVHPSAGILSRDAELALEKNEKCAATSVSLTNITVVAATVDSAVISYQPKVSGTCNGKKLDDERSVHTSVWAKRNGKWLTVLHQMTLLEGAAAMSHADPILGTWELNIAKSKYESGPPPKSHTRTYVQVGDEIKATARTVEADGKVSTVTWSFNASYDGKERPMTGADDGDSIAIKRVDANTFAATQKKAGKVTVIATRLMSADGKTMTLISRINPDSAGNVQTDVQVFEKRCSSGDAPCPPPPLQQR